MNLHNQLSVTYETQILENGRVVKRNAPKRNLLLDSGLDGIASRSFWDSFSYCVLGEGTTPTKRDSGAVTVSITSEVATASANYFEAADVGRLLKLDSGQEAYITGFTSATQVAVAGASDDSASEATIWYVNETGHGNEIVRTDNLGSNSGDNESTWDGSKMEHKRTFIFPTESSPKTYREIGWSHTSSSGGNLLGRDLIPGGGDSISAGQQYKVEVRLQITISPIVASAVSNVGTGGFDTSGEAIITHIGELLEGHGETGRFEPSSSKHRIDTKGSNFTLPTNPSTSNPSNSSGSEVSKDSYITGSRELVFRITFETNEANGDIYGVGFGGDFGASDMREYFLVKFTNPQTKDSDHTLEIAFRLSWGRTLTN